jgi:hypothetical protein
MPIESVDDVGGDDVESAMDNRLLSPCITSFLPVTVALAGCGEPHINPPPDGGTGAQPGPLSSPTSGK